MNSWCIDWSVAVPSRRRFATERVPMRRQTIQQQIRGVRQTISLVARAPLETHGQLKSTHSQGEIFQYAIISRQEMLHFKCRRRAWYDTSNFRCQY